MKKIPRFHIRSLLWWSYGLTCIFLLLIYAAFILFSKDALEDTIKENSKFYSYLFQDVLELQLNKDIELVKKASQEDSLREMFKRGLWSRAKELLKRYLPIDKELVFARVSSIDYSSTATIARSDNLLFALPQDYKCFFFGQKGHVFVAVRYPVKDENLRVLGYIEAVYRFPPVSLIERFSIENDLGIIFELKNGPMEFSSWLKDVGKEIKHLTHPKVFLKYDHLPIEEFFRFEFPIKLRGQEFKVIILKNSTPVKRDFHKFVFLISVGFLLVLAVLIFVAMFIQVMVIRPVFRLSQISESISSGEEVDWKYYDRVLATTEELNRLYQSYKNMVHSLVKAKSNAERANRLKDIFLSSVNHELRTPLSTIIGIVDLLDKAEDRDKQRQYLRIIKDSSKNLLVIVNAIVHFSKGTSGDFDIKYSEVNLREFLEDISLVYSLFAQRREVKFEVDIDNRLPSIVKTDPVRLRQVIYNLLNNAFKFTPSGRIDFIVRLISTEGSGEGISRCRVCFKVKDTGVGIAKDKQQEIFKPFVQVEEELSRKFGGMGLGLSISQKIITSMGGKIEVRSKEGEGSEFFFELEFKVISSSGKGKRDIAIKKSLSLPSSVSILLAEDDKVNQELLKEMFFTIGFSKVDVVDRGTLVIERIKQSSYEIIFMDINMPELDGITTARKIRELGVTTPIVALTGMAFEECEEKCLQAGMDAFLAKPFTLQGIKDVLDKFGLL